MWLASLDRASERRSLRQELALTHELSEASGPHPDREGRLCRGHVGSRGGGLARIEEPLHRIQYDRE